MGSFDAKRPHAILDDCQGPAHDVCVACVSSRGCSFLLFLIQTLGTKLDKTMYLAFEYAHLLIFFLALVSRGAANACSAVMIRTSRPYTLM